MNANQLEKTLEDFYKKAPPLPLNAKKLIVEWLPWFNLVVGLVSLLAAYGLWRAANAVSYLNDWANAINASYGGARIETNNLTFTVYLTLAVFAVEAVLCIMAFAPLKANKMAGWKLLFYISLANVVYGLVSLFNFNGGVGSLFGSLISTAIGLYFLFQIKDQYGGAKHVAAPATKAPEAPKEDKK